MNARTLYFGIACTLGLLAANGVSLAQPTDAGRSLAIEACSGCHQVIPRQKRPPPVSEGEEGAWTEAPTFGEIANRCLSAAELHAKIVNPHYPMREQILMPVDVDNLAIYIRSLATRPDCPIR
jgi:mono/diheme cytochrome c family protein